MARREKVKIHAITIDFWGTLLFDGPGTDNRYKRRRMADFERLLGAAGIIVYADDLDEAYDESASFLSRVWSQNRDVPAEDHVTAILDALDPGLVDRVPAGVKAALLDAYAAPALLVPPTVDDGALGALETLCARGYTLAVVSNTMRTPGATLRKLLEGYGLAGCFTHVTFSDEVGVRKPDPAIFNLTLQAIGAEPRHTVHVGDDMTLDVDGGRAAGLRVIQVTDAPLRALGVNGPDEVVPSLATLPDAISRLER